MSFTDWNPNEPNNVDKIEDYMCDRYDVNLKRYIGWNDYTWFVHLWTICELIC